MSQWTHVCGLIRYDDMRMADVALREQYEAALGKTVDWDDPHESWKACDVPHGSEGSVHWKLDENPDRSAVYAYTVSLWGDLRDYDDVAEIRKWFERCVLNDHFLVRQAVLDVEVENRESFTFVYKDESVIEYLRPPKL